MSKPGQADRRKARVLSMEVLCQLDVQGESFMLQVPGYLADSGEASLTINYAHKLIEGAWNNREVGDQELGSHTPGWSVKRMTPVVRNVLRTALAEFDLGKVPPKVIINEAIEIGCEYDTPDAGGFINGVLDSLWKSQTGEV